MQFGERPGQRKAYACSGLFNSIDAKEGLENFFAQHPGDQYPVIAHLYAERTFLFQRRQYPYHRFAGGIFHSISDKVADDLMKCFYIDKYIEVFLWQFKIE